MAGLTVMGLLCPRLDLDLGSWYLFSLCGSQKSAGCLLSWVWGWGLGQGGGGENREHLVSWKMQQGSGFKLGPLLMDIRGQSPQDAISHSGCHVGPA